MTSPIRVLHVAESAGWAGGEAYLVRLAAGLDRQRFALTVVVPETGPLTERLTALGISTFVVPLQTRLLSLRKERRRRVAEIALMDPATPIWFRLEIDLASMRVVADRMVTGAHFMSRRYLFDRRFEIVPPRRCIGAK